MLQAARGCGSLQDSPSGYQIEVHFGFLAEVDRQSVYQALDKLMRGDYEVEERMMLSGTVYRGNQVIGSDLALKWIL